MDHPVVKAIAGDNYYHDFQFDYPVNASWSATILDPNLDPIGGATITAVVLSEMVVRVTMDDSVTAALLDLEYKPLVRLRDDTLGITKLQWYLEMTK